MRFVRPLLLWIALALWLATVARAGLPEPSNWLVPALIPVVGHDAAGNPDRRGEVLIVARDLANTPVPGVQVVLDFGNCAEVRLCSDPHDPDAVVDCARGTIAKITDANGEVRFRVVGCSIGIPGTPGSGYSCARIYGDGVLQTFAAAAIYDLVGCNGLAPPDLSAWLADFFGPYNPARADYDGSGYVGASDFSLLLLAFFAAESIANCAGSGPCAP